MKRIIAPGIEVEVEDDDVTRYREALLEIGRQAIWIGGGSPKHICDKIQALVDEALNPSKQRGKYER